MRKLQTCIGSLVLTAAMTFAIVAHGVEPKAVGAPAPSRETRDQMATAHDKMAACLRSDKPFAECRAEMMKSCHSLGEHGCPMMDPMMDKSKMDMHKGMQKGMQPS